MSNPALPFKLPFTHYASLGYLPCPLDGKVPTGGVGWYQKQYDYAALDATGQNVGLRCENIVGFDIDVEDPDHAQEIEDVIRAALGLPAETPVRVGQAPKRLLIARVEEPTKGFDLTYKDDDGQGHTVFQLLGSGKQFVIHGTHPDTRRPYTLSHPLPAWGRLPLVTPEDLENVRRAVVKRLTAQGYALGAGSGGGKGKATGEFSGPRWNFDFEVQAVVEALQTIDPRCDRATWINVALALHDGFHGDDDGFDLFHAWSSGELHGIEVGKPKYKGVKDCSRQWYGFKPGGGITRATLFHVAEKGEFRVPTVAPEVPTDPGMIGEDLADLFMLEAGEVPWIVQNTITHGAHLLVGRPKGGKSWLTMDLAYAVGAGGTFLGRECRSAGVLWIAAEDTLEGLSRRLRTRGEMPPKGKVIVMTMEALRKERERQPVEVTFQQWLREFLDGHPAIELAILDTQDTIQAVWAGDDLGNKSNPVGQAYKQSRDFDQLGLDTQTCIMLVLHQGKMKHNAGTDYHERVNLPATVVAGATGSIVLGDLPDKDIHAEEDYQRVVALRGRHIQDEVLQIELRDGRAKALGTYIEIKQSETQQDTMAALEELLAEEGWPTKQGIYITYSALAKAVGKHQNTIAGHFKAMKKDPAKLRWKQYRVVAVPSKGVTLVGA